MTLEADLQAAVDAALVEDPPFSGVVLIRRGGETILERTLGFAQHAEQIPNRVDTRFGTASGCKIFTAIAVQQLIEQGRFALATPLCELLHIPYALDPAITVRHLLTHSSGLPDYYDEEVMSDQDCLDLMAEQAVYTLVSPQDYLPLFLDRPAKFAVGERFHYNNGAFVLLALLVEQQSGRSFPDYISEPRSSSVREWVTRLTSAWTNSLRAPVTATFASQTARIAATSSRSPRSAAATVVPSSARRTGASSGTPYTTTGYLARL